MKTLKKTMHTIVVDVMTLIVASFIWYGIMFLVDEGLETLYLYTNIVDWLRRIEMFGTNGFGWTALFVAMAIAIWSYNHLRDFILNGGKDIVKEETEEIKEIEGA